MADPLQGVLLEGNYYGYVSNSYSRNVPLKNSKTTTQDSRTFSALGKDSPSHTVTLDLSNTYSEYLGPVLVGTTTWLGVSRLALLEEFVGANGASQPITFVSPEGITRSVVGTGSLDVAIFNPEAPESTGIEYRVTLTLEEI